MMTYILDHILVNFLVKPGHPIAQSLPAVRFIRLANHYELKSRIYSSQSPDYLLFNICNTFIMLTNDLLPRRKSS